MSRCMSSPDDSFENVSLSDIPINLPEVEMTGHQPREKYAILLEAQLGYKASTSWWDGAKAILTFGIKDYDRLHVIAGSLLEIIEDSEVGVLADYIQPPPNYKVLSDSSHRLYCTSKVIKELNEQQMSLLLAVKSCNDRIAVLPKLEWIETLRDGSGAFVSVPEVYNCPTKVAVHYIGSLPDKEKEGFYFGVELLEQRSRGTTNGSYGDYALFNCSPNCGLFVSMDKLFLHDGTSAEPKAITRQPSSSVDNDKPFNIGDKVLAFDVKQNPVKATVKWVGKNEKAIPGVFIVGMYTDTMIFDSRGRFTNQITIMDSLINPKPGHTRLFLPFYCVAKDIGDNDTASHGHGYNTRHHQNNSSYNQPSTIHGERDKQQGISAKKQIEESKRINQEAKKIMEQEERERKQVQMAESGRRRNQQLQIKDELRLHEMEGFDDTMLDPDRQKEILEKIKHQRNEAQSKETHHSSNASDNTYHGDFLAQQATPHQAKAHHQVNNQQHPPMEQHRQPMNQHCQPMDQHRPHIDQHRQPIDQHHPTMDQYHLPMGKHHQSMDHHPPMDQHCQPMDHYHQPMYHCHQPMNRQPIDHDYQLDHMQMPNQDHHMVIGNNDYNVGSNSEGYSGGGGYPQQQGNGNAPYHQIDQRPAVHLQWHSSSQQQSDFNKILRAVEGPPISMGDSRLPQDHPYSSQQYRSSTGLRQEEGPPRPPPPVVGYGETHSFNQLPHGGSRYKFEEGDAVQTGDPPGDPPHYGTVKYIGELPGVVNLIAGVEMEDNWPGATDGWHDGYQYFQSKPGKGTFIRVDALQPDTRFVEHGKFSDKVPNPLGLFHWNDNAGKGTFAMPPVKVIEYIHTGIKKGIQGHQNSCYLDSTLFGLFAYSTVFDDLFLKDSPDEIGKIIKRTLLIIVNKLRQDYVVHFEAIMVLRNELDKLQQVKGLKSEEKDPEEFLNLLFKHVLNVEPFLMIKRPFGTDKEFFVQLFMEPDANRIPGTQELLCGMFKEQQITFKKHPLRLLLQIPRYGKQFKSFRGVIPSLELDVKTLCEGYVAVAAKVYPCFVCNKPGVVMCEDCGKEELKPKPYYYCQDCTTLWHGNPNRQHHKPLMIQPGNDADNDDTGNDVGRLRLLSVLCIETSHYVCFTRLEGSGTNEWVFFDSMAERPDDVHNLPQVTSCTTELNDWVYGTKDLARYTSKELPTLVRRFVEDAYLCIYVDHDGIMYGGDDA